jgi:hypothetical protein
MQHAANALTAVRDAITDDESRVPPGQTLCVTVLRSALCDHLQRIMRPAATGCAVVAARGTHPTPRDIVECER